MLQREFEIRALIFRVVQFIGPREHGVSIVIINPRRFENFGPIRIELFFVLLLILVDCFDIFVRVRIDFLSCVNGLRFVGLLASFVTLLGTFTLLAHRMGHGLFPQRRQACFCGRATATVYATCLSDRRLRLPHQPYWSIVFFFNQPCGAEVCVRKPYAAAHGHAPIGGPWACARRCRPRGEPRRPQTISNAPTGPQTPLRGAMELVKIMPSKR